MPLPLLTCLLAAATPITNTVPADAAAWLYVPALAPTLDRLARSTLDGALPLALPPKPAKSSKHATTDPAGALLTALVPAAGRAQRPDAILVLDTHQAEALVPTWRSGFEQLGFRAADRRQVDDTQLERLASGTDVLTLVSGLGRAGWATTDALALGLVKGAAAPLGTTASFLELTRESGAAPASPATAAPPRDFVGRIDVARWLGALARRPNGDRLVRFVTRLGLDRAREVTFDGALHEDGLLYARTRVDAGAPARGLVAALAGELPIAWPSSVPSDATSFVAASIAGAQAATVAEQFLISLAPLDAVVAQTHLANVEAQTGKRLKADVLGAAPRPWLVYERRSADNGTARVAVVGVQDAVAAQALAKGLVAVAPALDPRLKILWKQAGSAPMLVVTRGATPLVAVGFGKDVVVLAERAEAVAAHFAAGKGAKKVRWPSGEKALALGWSMDTLAATSTLTGMSAGPLPAKRLELGWTLGGKAPTFEVHTTVKGAKR